MPRAAQEGLRPGISLLTHAELIRPDLREYLAPKEIPIHPLVYESDFAFTAGFVEQVLASVPASVAADLLEIERLTGERLPVVVTDQEIEVAEGLWIGDKPMGDIQDDHFVDPTTKYLWVGSDPNIVLHSDVVLHISEPHRTHPMSKNKLRRYYVDSEKFRGSHEFGLEGIISWGQHNFSLGSEGLQLALRNFAIMFNNLGLQRVGAV